MLVSSGLVVFATLAGLPVAYEVDCRALPAAGIVGYKIKLIVGLQGLPDHPSHYEIGEAGGPDDAAEAIFDSLTSQKMKVKQDGLRITVYGRRDARVTKVTVSGDGGPVPLIRPVFVLPEPKK